MSAITVTVTAEHITAAGPPPDPTIVGGAFLPQGHRDPVERAIAELAGVDVSCDEDEPGREMATIGQHGNTLVLSLPPAQAVWIDRYYRGEAVEPFAFCIEIEAWLVTLLGRAA
jgi:hypothetical protein